MRRLLAILLLASFNAAGFGQSDPDAARFTAWCDHYGRVRVLMSEDVECQRHRACRFDEDSLSGEIHELNGESDSHSPYFWKENHAVWGLIHCQYVTVNEKLTWANRILSGGSHKPLPIDDDMRKCLL